MKILCPACNFSAEVANTKIPESGTNVCCPKCKTRFRIDKPYPEEVAPLKKNNSSPSYILCYFAMLFWVFSLVPTAIALYSKQEQLIGMQILVFGWLSPLVLNFAWFANLFFLFGLFRLLTGKSAVVYSALAVLLSLDTIRFTTYYLNEGGATTPVYGYGWGAVLWFLSLCMLLAASDTGRSDSKLHFLSLRRFGLSLCALIIGMSTYLAIHDRMLANSDERQNLAGLAFKRGAVCEVNDPVVSLPLPNLTGPLEVKVDKKASHADYPFNRPSSLLDWGIQSVRFGERDFFYDVQESNKQLVSVRASGPAAATLTVLEPIVDGKRQIQATLVEHPSERIVFDQVWVEEIREVKYCPDYKSFPDAEQYPRKLLVQALSLPLQPEQPKLKDRWKKYDDNQVNAVIVKYFSKDTLLDSKTDRTIKDFKNNPESKFHDKYNINCPDSIGVVDIRPFDVTTNLDTGYPFMINEKIFYPGIHKIYKSICIDNSAYLYTGSESRGKYIINIERKRFLDFKEMWAGRIIITTASVTSDNVITIKSITEGNGGVTIGLFNESSKETAEIFAPLNTNVCP